jgi:hypothetical protein
MLGVEWRQLGTSEPPRGIAPDRGRYPPRNATKPTGQEKQSPMSAMGPEAKGYGAMGPEEWFVNASGQPNRSSSATTTNQIAAIAIGSRRKPLATGFRSLAAIFDN